MPVGFWNDPEGAKYRAAYFSRFPNVWHHGDFAEWTEHGGMIIHGRSDATLNPGGVRIGTAEIYRQVEQLEEVQEAIVIGQEWDNDVRVVLFVVLQPGIALDEPARAHQARRSARGASPRHVPARIVQVADIPRTKSGKITELAVRDVVHGREVKNKEALANPEALELYRGLRAAAIDAPGHGARGDRPLELLERPLRPHRTPRTQPVANRVACRAYGPCMDGKRAWRGFWTNGSSSGQTNSAARGETIC